MANVCLPWSEAISVLHPPVKVGAMTTMLELADKVTTEADAYRWLEELRWPYGVQCPHCHGTEVALMVPKNGVSRKATNGSMTQRRVWQCRPCRKQFSAISGTVMHGTKASVRVWCLVIFQMISAKNGISCPRGVPPARHLPSYRVVHAAQNPRNNANGPAGFHHARNHRGR